MLLKFLVLLESKWKVDRYKQGEDVLDTNIYCTCVNNFSASER